MKREMLGSLADNFHSEALVVAPCAELSPRGWGRSQEQGATAWGCGLPSALATAVQVAHREDVSSPLG